MLLAHCHLRTFSSIVRFARLLSFGVVVPTALLPTALAPGLGVDMMELMMEEEEEKGAGEAEGESERTAVGLIEGFIVVALGLVKDGFNAII